MGLDQFYTKPEIVDRVLSLVDLNKFDYILEPSAGAGDFLQKLPKDRRVGIDLEPASSEIKKADFFDFTYDTDQPVLTIGNPPFGKNSSLAVRFFNHAGEFSDCIAFIVPRTFRKPSVINRLNPNFHLIRELILPLNSFYIPAGGDYKVPTVFQVWERRRSPREKIETVRTHSDFKFISITSSPSAEEKERQRHEADFCIRRVGAGAGKVYDCRGEKYRDFKSHYYIKSLTPDAENILRSIDWDYPESPKYDTAGNPSISKDDLIRFYIEHKRTF